MFSAPSYVAHNDIPEELEVADIFSFATSTIIQGAAKQDHAHTLEKVALPRSTPAQK